MGFLSDENGYIEKNSLAKYIPDVSGGIRQLYVYAPNLVEDTIVGNVTAPLLRVVNVEKKPGEIDEIIYTSEFHQRLVIKRISQIQIQITSASGELINFHWGNIILTLHFKRALF